MPHSRRLRNPQPNETAVAGVNGEGHRPQPVSTCQHGLFQSLGLDTRADLGWGCDIDRRGPGVALLCAGMAKRRRRLKQPHEYLEPGCKWPDGPFEENPPEVLAFYVEIVKRLKDACEAEKRKEGKEVAEIASEAGVGVQTVYNILQGKSWCELPTIYRLEKALNKPLWHHRHITRPR